MRKAAAKKRGSERKAQKEEKALIIRHYRRLLRKAQGVLKTGDVKQIRMAFNLALSAHQGSKRKSGEPYIIHPLAVAEITVSEIGLGTTSIISAILHDVVEDTDLKLKEIGKKFGPKVERIIDGLTKIKGSFDYGSSEQAENFRKMLLTLSEDVRVIFIKIADRLHNMRTLESMPRDKQLKISNETMYLYAPLAHRLGLYNIKSELEDHYIRFNEKEAFEMISGKIKETKDARNRFIRDFIKPVKQQLQSENFSFEVKGRPKSIFSIYSKMKKQNIPFEEVYDLFAVRIILDVTEDQEKSACWHVYSQVTDIYRPNPDRLRDWVSTPKANGYESLHSTVMSNSGQWVEVQIRTKRMDDIAEKGYAAHWKYKFGESKKSSSGLDTWLNKVRDALEQNELPALEFIDDFRANLFSDELFVFTPKGQLKSFPAGATALDFAFEIHTDIGTGCIGAKANHKLVPLSYKLRNGDQVEILTSKKQKPTEDWLKFVVTSKAKSKIKQSLKEGRKKLEEHGSKTMATWLSQGNIETTGDLRTRLRAYFNAKTDRDLFYKVGFGSVDKQDFKRFLIFLKKAPKSINQRIKDATSFKNELKKITGKKGDMLLIGEDMSHIDYKLAQCCNPIPGDDVFGFVTINDGIKIHRTTCPNALELMSHYGYRIVKAKWTKHKELAFLAGIKVLGTDRVGMINDLSEVISTDLKVNMRSITVDTEANMFEGEISVFVYDTNHLNKMINRLSKIEGVESVTRFD
jgi:GTP diphosphokinase / guanosine-3',5'-bis(diphosphate) 3'-diphosphatase